jgi:xanthine dehydrogenase iron-sulfur cluster and FAD-binding subunit A
MDLAQSGLFRLYSYIAPTQELAGVMAGAGTGEVAACRVVVTRPQAHQHRPH